MVKKDNGLNLFKKRAIIRLMKEKDINRVNSEVIEFLSQELSKDVEKITSALKQNMAINARKTLHKQDVIDVLKQMNPKEEFEI